MKTLFTGQKCSCKRGIERDNCSNCEGTGKLIDFRAMRSRAQDKCHCGNVKYIGAYECLSCDMARKGSGR